jgi:signal transduction histidine kinase
LNLKIIIFIFLSFFLESNGFQFQEVFISAQSTNTELNSFTKVIPLKVFNPSIQFHETDYNSSQNQEPNNNKIEAVAENYRKQNRLFGMLIILLITLFLWYLVRNSLRKKNIKLETNNKILIENILDIELDVIDSILDIQEKERNRFTDDLFDKLGSEIATIRHFIDGIKSEDSTLEEKDQFLEKLQFITEVTYKDVQKLEKLKNISVPLNNRLIPSVISLAKIISGTGKLQIKVHHFEIMAKINFRIELEIVRLIQILLLNLVRNNQATFASIRFSKDENILNVIVEDNTANKWIKDRKDSQFIKIEKRLKNIGGSINFASITKNENTTILNIPI